MAGKTFIGFLQFIVGCFFLLNSASDIQLGFGLLFLTISLVNLFEVNHDAKKK